MLGNFFWQKGKHYILQVRSTFILILFPAKEHQRRRFSYVRQHVTQRLHSSVQVMGGARFLLVYSSKFELVAFFLVTVISLRTQQLPLFPPHLWTTARKEATLPEQFDSYLCLSDAKMYLYNYVYTNATPSSVQRMYSLVQKPVTTMAHHHCGTAGSFTRETGFGHLVGCLLRATTTIVCRRGVGGRAQNNRRGPSLCL